MTSFLVVSPLALKLKDPVSICSLSKVLHSHTCGHTQPPSTTPNSSSNPSKLRFSTLVEDGGWAQLRVSNHTKTLIYQTLRLALMNLYNGLEHTYTYTKEGIFTSYIRHGETLKEMLQRKLEKARGVFFPLPWFALKM